jgi:hypothetical protein
MSNSHIPENWEAPQGDLNQEVKVWKIQIQAIRVVFLMNCLGDPLSAYVLHLFKF